MESLLIREEGKERTFLIESRVVTVGRSGKSEIVLKDRNASRQHCNIIKVGESWFAVDCESHNGTFVNGERIKKKELKEGDKISIGAVEIIFSLSSRNPAPENTEKTEEIPEFKEGKQQAPQDKKERDEEDDSADIVQEEIHEVIEEIEIEKPTKKVDRMIEVCPTKQVRPEIAKMVLSQTPAKEEDMDIHKEENLRRDLEKLSAMYQKFNVRMSWETIGLEKFGKRFLMALLAGGHCLIRGETSLVSGFLFQRMAKILGLTCGYYFGSKDCEFPRNAHLVLAPRLPSEKIQPFFWQSLNPGQMPVPWMMIMADSSENAPIEWCQNVFLFPVSLSPLKLEEEVAFLQMALDPPHLGGPITSAQELVSFQLLLEAIKVPSGLLEYITHILRATRPTEEGAPKSVQEKIAHGAEPSMGIWIVKAARARAALQGKDVITAKDVQSVSQYLIPLQLQLTTAAQRGGENVKTIYNAILNQVKEPNL